VRVRCVALARHRRIESESEQAKANKRNARGVWTGVLGKRTSEMRVDKRNACGLAKCAWISEMFLWKGCVIFHEISV